MRRFLPEPVFGYMEVKDMYKRIIIVLMLVLSIAAVMGCSSESSEVVVATADPDGDQDIGPKEPEKVYIAAGKDDLDSAKLPDYLKDDLEIESAKVTVEIAGSKWEIVAGTDTYEVHYHDFNDDAAGAIGKFEAFIADFNAEKAAVAVDHLARKPILYVDGDKFRKKGPVQQKLQQLIKPVGGGFGGAKKGEKWPVPFAVQDIYISGTLGYFQAWLYAESGLGSRGKTWVYLEKDDVDDEWAIEGLHTGGEDDPEISWQVKEEYKRLD